MAKNYRPARLGEEIKKTVGNMLLTGLKDHRLQGKMISVSDVEVSSDGSYATVYLSVMGQNFREDASEEEKKEILAAMKSASGILRREIGRSVKVRHIPELTFKIDSSLEYGRHMSAVIDSLHISGDETDQEETDPKEENAEEES